MSSGLDIKLKYLVEATLTNNPVDNGSIYVTTDTKRLYVDLLESRILIDGNIYLETDSQRQMILAPLSNKLYIVKETHTIWMFIADSWVQFGNSGGGGVSDYNLLTNLPQINNVEIKGNKSLSELGIQSISDETLATENKTIVGAINELNTSLSGIGDILDNINGEQI